MMSLEIHDDCKTGRTINSLIIILFSQLHDRNLAVATKPSSHKLLLLNQPRFEKQWKKPSTCLRKRGRKCRWNRNLPNMKSPEALPLPPIPGTQHTLLFPYICLDHFETCFILQGKYHCDLTHYEIKIFNGKTLDKCFTDRVY